MLAKKTILLILDGWGHGDQSKSDAIHHAKTPFIDRLYVNYPHAELVTYGQEVGLPDGQMGNSEVGHLNIGAGRIVYQDLAKINKACAENTLESMPKLCDSFQYAKENNKPLHLMGLVSDGGIHSHSKHLFELCRLANEFGVKEVYVHAFTDGRDTDPKSGKGFLEELEQNLYGAKIASVCGRYYAMDRDNRWDRVIKAHNAISNAIGEKASSAIDAIDNAYNADLTDEFIESTIIGNYKGMQNGDGLLMANFRADRAREIMATFVDPHFSGFEKQRNIDLSSALSLTKYSDELIQYMDCLFPTDPLKETLGEIVSDHNLKQLRIAETEKFAHVTFFFNGGNEDLYEGEERILIPSPDVPTYNLKPEMSAPEVTDKLVEAIHSNSFDLIVVNFANPDMVGHTGVLDAALKAVETIDTSLGLIHDALTKVSGSMLITADHGNIELMKNPDTGAPHTAHTTNLVPFILLNEEAAENKEITLQNGALCDIAPTILALMNINKPDTMTGRNLIS